MPIEIIDRMRLQPGRRIGRRTPARRLSGMIRATVSAVPQRRLVLVAKTIVFTVTALILGIFSSFAAYFMFQAFLSDDACCPRSAMPGFFGRQAEAPSS